MAVQTRVKFTRDNRMLKRKQVDLEFSHLGKPGPSRVEARDLVARQLKVPDPKTVMITGMACKYGGGRTKAVAIVYDTIEALTGTEARYKQLRMKIDGIKDNPNRRNRKARKDIKSKCLRLRSGALHKYRKSLKK